MKEYTLVVMAAGMGSRFGGLKQITPVDEDGNFLIDYSVYDAKKAGFTKVVFVIKEENLKDFQDTIGNRLKDKIEVCYAFQKLEDIPVDKSFPMREKPWGTVQAILASEPYVSSSFAVINADDFYGYSAYEEAISFLKTVETPYTYASISYPFGVTSSLSGAVKRGVLKFQGEEIIDMIESSIVKTGEDVIATPLNGDAAFSIPVDAPVSMNFFAFQHDIYTILHEYWESFFQNEEDYILSHEALLPDCLKENLEKKKITIYHRPSKGTWIGMTYKSDLDSVKEKLNEMKENNEYPSHLWE